MPVPAAEMSSRWERLQQAMANLGLEGLLVFSNQLKPASIRYVADYFLFGTCAFCYLPPAGRPVLLISEAWDLDRAVRETALTDVRILGKDWPREVADLCRATPGKLGLAGREIMGRLDLAALEKALGKETVSASRFLENAAVIKSPYEREQIRASAKMADAGFLRALEVIREGLADFELVAEIDEAMRRMGAVDNFQMLAVGKQISGMLLPFGKKIERGDRLLFEITPTGGPETYSAQLCRTALFGAAPDKLLLEKYRLLIEALEESLAIVKPGVRIGEVARIQNGIIGAAGYEEYCRPPYMRARGHGFGLGRIDIDEDSPLAFAEGMSLVVHPNQFLPETSYLALGEHILVTESGIERLTRTESKLYECLYT